MQYEPLAGPCAFISVHNHGMSVNAWICVFADWYEARSRGGATVGPRSSVVGCGGRLLFLFAIIVAALLLPRPLHCARHLTARAVCSLGPRAPCSAAVGGRQKAERLPASDAHTRLHFADMITV